MAKPIVKWAGGKTQLLNKLIPLVPEFNTYYEPFIGGGALFFALEPQNARINDFNPQLVNLYNQIKNNADLLVNELDSLAKKHEAEVFYYAKREEYNECLKNNELSVKSAALFLYLNKAGFNGLYRLNSSGLFNTPSGKKKKVNLYDLGNIESVKQVLLNAEITNLDFESACKSCKKGDFVFFDSPYYNTFDTYKAGGFSENDHIRLSQLFEKLTDKGVKCLLTNSNEKFIKDLYKKYDINVVKVKRMINCDGKNRTGEEIIVKNY